MTTKLFLIALIIMFSSFESCTINKNVELSSNKFITSAFDNNEIKSLEAILQFFDTIIIKSTEINDVNNAYHTFFDTIRKSLNFETERILIKNAFAQDGKKLIQELKVKGLFSQIWQNTYSWNGKNRNDTIYTYLTLNLQGKYFKFLEIESQKNKFISSYSNSIKSSGGLSPIPVGLILKGYDEDINFDDESLRLIWAIHYITLFSEETYKKQTNEPTKK